MGDFGEQGSGGEEIPWGIERFNLAVEGNATDSSLNEAKASDRPTNLTRRARSSNILPLRGRARPFSSQKIKLKPGLRQSLGLIFLEGIHRGIFRDNRV